MSPRLLEVEELSVSVGDGSGDRSILREVCLTLDAGEALGLVGESGSGKSMTAKAIARALPASATVRGRISFAGSSVLDLRGPALRTYRRSGVAVIPQDPRASIDPVRTVGDFLAEPLTTFGGRTRARARQEAADTMAEVGIQDGARVLRQFPHQLSGGMLQRVMICAALLAGARLILADEPTTALDVTTQSEVMAVLNDLRREHDLAMLFITHDLELATAVCDRISVMYAGQILENRAATELESDPWHPYARALLDARPSLQSRGEPLRTVPGRAISAWEAHEVCAFEPRCPRATPECSSHAVALARRPGGDVRCLNPLVSPLQPPTREVP